MQLEPYNNRGELDQREGQAMAEQDASVGGAARSGWSGFTIVLVWGGGLALMVIAFVYGVQRLVDNAVAESSEDGAPGVATPGTKAEAETIAAVAELKVLQERQKVVEGLSAERTKIALARAESKRLLDLADEVRGAIEHTRRELKSWGELRGEILTNEQGRRLATSREAVVTLKEEFAVERPSDARLQSMLDTLGELVRPAEESRALGEVEEGFYLPEELVFTKLHELAEETRKIAASYAHAKITVRGLLRGAGEPGTLTLADAIEEEEARRARNDAEERTKRIDAVLRETLAERLDEEEAVVRALVEEEVATMRAERETKEKETRLRELVARAKREGVADQLAAFTTPGYYVFSGPNHEQKQPYSLSHLHSLGALKPTSKGLETLYQVAHFHHDRDRPRWNWNAGGNILKPGVDDRVREIQDMLNEYGEALVEMGLLLP